MPSMAPCGGLGGVCEHHAGGNSGSRHSACLTGAGTRTSSVAGQLHPPRKPMSALPPISALPAVGQTPQWSLQRGVTGGRSPSQSIRACPPSGCRRPPNDTDRPKARPPRSRGYSCLKTTRKGLQMWRREAASRLATGAPARVPGADDARTRGAGGGGAQSSARKLRARARGAEAARERRAKRLASSLRFEAWDPSESCSESKLPSLGRSHLALRQFRPTSGPTSI